MEKKLICGNRGKRCEGRSYHSVDFAQYKYICHGGSASDAPCEQVRVEDILQAVFQLQGVFLLQR